MSGRCKACDTKLDDLEMVRKWPGTQEFCDLCSDCFNEEVDDPGYDDDLVYYDEDDWY